MDTGEEHSTNRRHASLLVQRLWSGLCHYRTFYSLLLLTYLCIYLCLYGLGRLVLFMSAWNYLPSHTYEKITDCKGV